MYDGNIDNLEKYGAWDTDSVVIMSTMYSVVMGSLLPIMTGSLVVLF